MKAYRRSGKPVESWQSIQGWFDDNEMQAMLELTRGVPEGGIVVEIGVWKGRSFCGMGVATEGKRHVAVDHFQGSGKPWHDDDADLPQLRQVFEDNLKKFGMHERTEVLAMESTEAAQHFQDGSVDLLLVDGGHETVEVEADVDAWWPKIRPGGKVAFHDWDKPWCRDGVKNKLAAIKEMSGREACKCLFIATKARG